MVAFFLYLLYTVASGLQQGLIVWLLARYVAPRYQEWVDAAFHKGGALIYGFIVAAVVYYQCRLAQVPFNSKPFWPIVGMGCLHAFLLRVAFFDISLNLARFWFSHRENEPAVHPFAVGGSASSDKVILAIAAKLGKQPESIRLLLVYLSVIVLGLVLLFLPTY